MTVSNDIQLQRFVLALLISHADCEVVQIVVGASGGLRSEDTI